MKQVLVVVAVLGLVLSAGCGKKAKCEKGFDQVKEFMVGLAKAFDKEGKKDPAAEMDKEKDKFIEECQKLDDATIDCIADFKTKMTDPECIKKLDDAKLMKGAK